MGGWEPPPPGRGHGEWVGSKKWKGRGVPTSPPLLKDRLHRLGWNSSHLEWAPHVTAWFVATVSLNFAVLNLFDFGDISDFCSIFHFSGKQIASSVFQFNCSAAVKQHYWWACSLVPPVAVSGVGTSLLLHGLVKWLGML